MDARKGPVYLTNSILGGAVTHAGPTISATGPVYAYHNLIIAPWWSGHGGWVRGSLSADVGNIYTNADPRWRANARVGYLLPNVDDSSNFTYALSLSSILARYHRQGTFFLQQSTWHGENTAALRNMVQTGVMEVGCHGYSHSSLYARSGLDFAYRGGHATYRCSHGWARH